MKPKRIYSLAEGKPLSAGREKNECRNERYPVGVESESRGRAEIRSGGIAQSGAARLRCRGRRLVRGPIRGALSRLIYVDWLVEGKLWQNEWAGTDGLEAIRRYNEL